MHHCSWLQKWLHLNSKLDIQYQKKYWKIYVQTPNIPTVPMLYSTLISGSSSIIVTADSVLQA